MEYLKFREKIIDYIAKSGQDVQSFCKSCKISNEEFGRVMAYELKTPMDIYFKIAFFIGLKPVEFFESA